jgi:hypothetical protein
MNSYFFEIYCFVNKKGVSVYNFFYSTLMRVIQLQMSRKHKNEMVSIQSSNQSHKSRRKYNLGNLTNMDR